MQWRNRNIAYRFFSDLTDNDQIIFVGVNSQLVLQCNPSDVSEHYEEAEVANLEVRLPTTSQMGKLSLYDKRLKSKDGNVELRLDSSTLIVRKMTYALYGSYVCHFTPILGICFLRCYFFRFHGGKQNLLLYKLIHIFETI